MWSKAKEKIIFVHKIHRLEEFDTLKLFPGENILLVERQHWIVLVVPFLVILLVLVLIAGLITVGLSYAHVYSPNLANRETAYLMSTLIAATLTAAVFIFMRWYYQFYVITNKRLLHVHFFRIGGFYLEEIFLEKLLECEVETKASNFIYDMMDIFDVYVHFGNIEHKDPFVFQAPAHADAIEDLVNEHAIKQHRRENVEPI